MTSRLRTPLALVGFALILAATYLAPHQVEAPRVSEPGVSRSIVVFDPESSLSVADQEALISRFGQPIKPLPFVQAWAAMLSVSARGQIESEPAVRYVEDDGKSYAYQSPLAWSINRIGAERVWGGAVGASQPSPRSNAGAGVNVAVIDSGIDVDHPDLRDNYRGGKDFVRGDDVPDDEYGHGTHVAGIIAAEGKASVIGVAPRVNLYALKVLDEHGAGWYSDIIDALGWSVDHGMQVVNISHGGKYNSRALRRAVDKAYRAGVLIIASAGNEGSPEVIYPAGYENAIAVSAVNLDDKLASFSNYGPRIELSAPGVLIPSTMPTYQVTLNNQPFSASRSYALLSGTSMAAPHVTGTAALIIASGVKGNENVRKRLRTTVEDLGKPGRDDQFGFGLINAAAAAGIAPAPTRPGSPTGSMHVSKIETTTGIRVTQSNRYVWALATITIVDEKGEAVEGVTVDGHWELATADAHFDTTNHYGQARIQSAPLKNPEDGTTYKFVVDSAAKDGWTWMDKPGEKSATIAVGT